MRSNRGRALTTVVYALAIAGAAGAGLASARQVRGELSTLPRRVSTRATGAILGSISPDGRFFAFADWSTPGDLAIQDLETGEYRRLTNTGAYSANQSSISPDGKQIAYAWRNSARAFELRLIGIDGSNSRIVYSNNDVHVFPFEWSRDARQILVQLDTRGGSHQIALVSVGDGAVRVLKALDSRQPERLAFSPDGRFVVYDLATSKTAPGRDLFLLTVDNGSVVPLVQGPADDFVLGWAPDGVRVLFGRRRDGTVDAWAVQVTAGQRQGSPVLVTRDLGQIRSIGFSRAGSFYYSRPQGFRDVFLASLDQTTGQLEEPAMRANGQSDDPKFGPAWSPDGEHLAYFSTRGGTDVGPGARTIVIRSVKTGEEHALHPKLGYPDNHPYELRWSPDARTLLTIANDERGRWSFYLVDGQTGGTTILVRGRPGEKIRWPSWSPDGMVLFYAQYDLTRQVSTLVMRQLKTSRVTEIYRAPMSSLEWERANTVTLSPDGGHLAFALNNQGIQSRSLMVVPTAGGEAREVLRVRSLQVVSWTSDGRRVFFRGVPDDSSEMGLWSIAREGGTPRKIGSAANSLGLWGFSVHPDGQQIAFTAAPDAGDEVWVINNFLPPLKAAK